MSYNLDPKKITKEEWLFTNCKEHSLYIITNYSKTEYELRKKLKQRQKYTDEIIDKTIEFLKKYNYLNDEDFAKRFIEIHKDTKSKRYIKQKLLIKGIDNKTIDKVFLDNDDTFDDYSVAIKLINKKYPEYKEGNLDMTLKQKIYNYLYRKGISYDIISNIIKEYIN